MVVKAIVEVTMGRHRGNKRHRFSGVRGCALLAILMVLAILVIPPLRRAVYQWLPGLPELPELPGFLTLADQPTAGQPTSIQPEEWDEAMAPNYYRVAGPADFDAMPAIGVVMYSPLDALGRAGKVLACVDANLCAYGSSRERVDMSNLEPSGWGYNEEADIVLPTGNVYHGYFWNRSHLLAKSLGGEEVEENLVCGTRMQNVGANLNGTEGGMAYCETIVRKWLEQNPNGYVLYSATPVYRAEELVCRNVIVDIHTSDGSIDQQVVVYNAAKGYSIDYATGRFAKAAAP